MAMVSLQISTSFSLPQIQNNTFHHVQSPHEPVHSRNTVMRVPNSKSNSSSEPLHPDPNYTDNILAQTKENITIDSSVMVVQRKSTTVPLHTNTAATHALLTGNTAKNSVIPEPVST